MTGTGTGTGSAPEVRRAARRGRLSARDMTGDGRDGEGRWIDFAGAEENGERCNLKTSAQSRREWNVLHAALLDAGQIA